MEAGRSERYRRPRRTLRSSNASSSHPRISASSFAGLWSRTPRLFLCGLAETAFRSRLGDIRGSHQSQVEELQTALGREHDLSLHALGDRIVLDDFQRELGMLVVVVGMLAYPLVGPGVHFHAGLITVSLEARGNLSRKSARHAFDGKARRGHGFRE